MTVSEGFELVEAIERLRAHIMHNPDVSDKTHEALYEAAHVVRYVANFHLEDDNVQSS